MSEEKFLFREVLNAGVVEELAGQIKKTYPRFDATGFVSDINSNLGKLSFGARSALISDKLAEYLPGDFRKALEILVNSLGPEPEGDSLSGYNGFIIMPQCDFIAKYGIEYPDESLHALYEMTKRFSAEGQIRAFIIRYPEKTYSFLEKLTKDKSPFARRLASEGTRPRLPLGQRLQVYIKDPRPVIKLLDRLVNDPNLMVRRSVANNINDIAKDNPDIAVETLKRWAEKKSPETEWLVKHAARTLLKLGNKGALELLGFSSDPAVSLTNLKLSSKKIVTGEKLCFSFSLQSLRKSPRRLLIDYAIHYMKANGRTKPKVFKLSQKTIGRSESLEISKCHSFGEITTRKHYPGQHKLEILINGRSYGEAAFTLSLQQNT
ncbi:MAG: DNA alkylation repair protein [Ignavibacteriaceae bacterium]|nr:DNA alkylation repair protein [Ignavibacteriaceae bacterium]